MPFSWFFGAWNSCLLGKLARTVYEPAQGIAVDILPAPSGREIGTDSPAREGAPQLLLL
jgi:hypothetical protein